MNMKFLNKLIGYGIIIGIAYLFGTFLWSFRGKVYVPTDPQKVMVGYNVE